jgi:SAM-dependent methyltransferase
MNFLVGDSSKRYKTSLDKAMTKGYATKYLELMNNIYNKNAFNIISFMFSLHYFFKNKETLNNIIDNINDHLAVDGLLIGACFNGDLILQEFINKLQDLYVYKDGKLILKIVPKFLKDNLNKKWLEKGELPDTEESLGLDIDVYVYSINKLITEYLVNFRYFTKKLAEYNIVPLSLTEIKNMNLPDNKSIGSFKDIYELMTIIVDKKISVNDNTYKAAEEIIKILSEDEFNISKLNTYFIYVKKSGLKRIEKEVAKVKKVTKEVSKVELFEDKEMKEYMEKYNEFLKEYETIKMDYKKLVKFIKRFVLFVKENYSNENKDILKFNKNIAEKEVLKINEYLKSLK